MSYQEELRKLLHALNETPVVGQASPVWELPELQRLVKKYPVQARQFLAELPDTAPPSTP